MTSMRAPSKPYPPEGYPASEAKERRRKGRRRRWPPSSLRWRGKTQCEEKQPTSPLARLNRKTTGGRRPWRGEGSKESLRDRESLEVDARWKGRIIEVPEHRGRDRRAEAGVAGNRFPCPG